MPDHAGARAEIIPPSDHLARKAGGFVVDPAQLEDIDDALASLGDRYAELTRGDLDALIEAWHRLQSLAGDAEAQDTVHRIAHGFKGNGTSVGYPLVTAVADSLCRLINSEAVARPRGQRALGAHIDALAAVLSLELRGDGGTLGQQLMAELTTLVDGLAREASETNVAALPR
jgi:HPt (histidine-containing phosphotransfer) domain-containing protein